MVVTVPLSIEPLLTRNLYASAIYFEDWKRDSSEAIFVFSRRFKDVTQACRETLEDASNAGLDLDAIGMAIVKE
jgi:hypothetical protein